RRRRQSPAPLPKGACDAVVPGTARPTVTLDAAGLSAAGGAADPGLRCATVRLSRPRSVADPAYRAGTAAQRPLWARRAAGQGHADPALCPRPGTGLPGARVEHRRGGPVAGW